jgi:hypothetical protein
MHPIKYFVLPEIKLTMTVNVKKQISRCQGRNVVSLFVCTTIFFKFDSIILYWLTNKCHEGHLVFTRRKMTGNLLRAGLRKKLQDLKSK